VYLEKKRAPEQQSSDWLVLQEKTLFRGLEALSEALGEKLWYMGNSMTLAILPAAACWAISICASPKSTGGMRIPIWPGSPQTGYARLVQRHATRHLNHTA